MDQDWTGFETDSGEHFAVSRTAATAPLKADKALAWSSWTVADFDARDANQLRTDFVAITRLWKRVDHALRV